MNTKDTTPPWARFAKSLGKESLAPRVPAVPDPTPAPAAERTVDDLPDTRLDASQDTSVGAFVAETLAERLPGKRWTAADELACTARCKRCGQPIIWGQCDADSRDGKDVGRWFPLDPDMGLHGCGSGAARVEYDKRRMAYEAGINKAIHEPIGMEAGE